MEILPLTLTGKTNNKMDSVKAFTVQSVPTSSPQTPNALTPNVQTPRSAPSNSPRSSRMPKKSESEKNLKKKHKIHLDDESVVDRDKHEEMIQTVSLLESKLVSLTNINCALQSQIDEMSAAYYKLKGERDELKKERDNAIQELETLKLKKREKEKREKESERIMVSPLLSFRKTRMDTCFK